jgi:hypothetical protein
VIGVCLRSMRSNDLSGNAPHYGSSYNSYSGQSVNVTSIAMHHEPHDSRDYRVFRVLSKAEKKDVLLVPPTISGPVFYRPMNGNWLHRFIELRGGVLVKREKERSKPTHFWDIADNSKFVYEKICILKDDPITDEMKWAHQTCLWISPPDYVKDVMMDLSSFEIAFKTKEELERWQRAFATCHATTSAAIAASQQPKTQSEGANAPAFEDVKGIQ